MSTWTAVRVFDLVLYVAVLGLFTTVVHRRVRAKNIGAPELLFRTGLVIFLTASGYATAESLHQGNPGGPRLILLTIGLLWMLIAIVQIERTQRKKRP